MFCPFFFGFNLNWLRGVRQPTSAPCWRKKNVLGFPFICVFSVPSCGSRLASRVKFSGRDDSLTSLHCILLDWYFSAFVIAMTSFYFSPNSVFICITSSRPFLLSACLHFIKSLSLSFLRCLCCIWASIGAFHISALSCCARSALKNIDMAAAFYLLCAFVCTPVELYHCLSFACTHLLCTPFVWLFWEGGGGGSLLLWCHVRLA